MGVYIFDYFDGQAHVFQEIWNHEPHITDDEMKSLLSNPTDLFLQSKLMTDSTVPHSTSGLFLLIFGWAATAATDAAVHCGQPVSCPAFHCVFLK